MQNRWGSAYPQFCHWLTHHLYSLNSWDLFLNLRRLVKMTKPLRFKNKPLRLKFKCLICIWIIFWAILDLFINPKYLFQISLFHRLIILNPKKKFCHFNKSIRLKNNPGNLESNCWVKSIRRLGKLKGILTDVELRELSKFSKFEFFAYFCSSPLRRTLPLRN